MANRFFGMNRGQTFTDVSDAASTQSKDIEINIDLSKNLLRSEIEMLMDQIEAYIITKTANLGE